MRRGSCVRDRRVVQGSFLFFPVLRRGSLTGRYTAHTILFLFFPVLRRGSTVPVRPVQSYCFYSSPSCDGDLSSILFPSGGAVSILPRLATGIRGLLPAACSFWFLFFPVLRRGSIILDQLAEPVAFLFFPVLRRGSEIRPFRQERSVSILPRLATGIRRPDGTGGLGMVSILPRLATGISVP